MRLHGTVALADLLADFVAYRKLCPADTRLPALQDIQPGSPPRKGEPAYAAVVAPMLQAARMLSSPAALQRLIVVGDTQRSDLGLFHTCLLYTSVVPQHVPGRLVQARYLYGAQAQYHHGVHA